MRIKPHQGITPLNLPEDKTSSYFSRSFLRQQVFISGIVFILIASLLAIAVIILNGESLPTALIPSYAAIFFAGVALTLISVQVTQSFLPSNRPKPRLYLPPKQDSATHENIENLRVMLDNTPLSFVLLDTDMNVKSWNAFSEQQALELSNIQLKKSLSALEVIEPQNHDKFRAIFAKVLGGEPYTTEYAFVSVQGKDVTQEWRYTPVTDDDGKVVSVCVMIANITERAKAERGWRESEQVFGEIAENLGEMLWVRDRKTRKIIYASPSYVKLYGRPVQNLLDNADDFMNSVHPDDRQWIKDETKLNLADKKPYNVEYRVINEDGKIRWIWARSYRLFNEKGEAYRSVGIAEDITHFKEAEKQAGELMLERERTTLLSNFVRDISHEFRTPLATIKSGLHLLEFATTEDQRTARVERINKQVDTILQLVEDLVTMARLDNIDQVELQRGNLTDLLQAILLSQKADASQKQIELTLDIPADTPYIHADMYRLRQAITNLLSNAIRYTPHNGKVSVSAHFDQNKFIIKVIDTGMGIDSESLPHIYNSFYRVDAARSTAGSGLGLTVAKRIIELQGGKITVESQEGVGSTFTITLPNHEPTPQTT